MDDKKAEKWATELCIIFRFNGDVFVRGKKQSKFMSSYYRKKFRQIAGIKY